MQHDPNNKILIGGVKLSQYIDCNGISHFCINLINFIITMDQHSYYCSVHDRFVTQHVYSVFQFHGKATSYLHSTKVEACVLYFVYLSLNYLASKSSSLYGSCNVVTTIVGCLL